MKHIILFAAISLAVCHSHAQDLNGIIRGNEVLRIEETLASDHMQGREAGTPGGIRAAAFIAEEFQKAGLQPMKGTSFQQPFSMVKTKLRSSNVVLNGNKLGSDRLIGISPKGMLSVSNKSGYATAVIGPGEGRNALMRAAAYLQGSENTIVWIDESYASVFPRLNSLRRSIFDNSPDILFVLTSTIPDNYLLELVQEVDKLELRNIAGVLPGSTRKNEYVIFSGHFDHLGIAGTPENGDSVYNGANDDAAGITAVILLAKYFKTLNNNERTILFVAFDAEEIGGFGSQYFSKQLNPEQVVAMFNIEMIGTPSKWGDKSAYITGYEKTDMGAILEKNLQGSAFRFYPDPYPKEQLFYRSDNATLARLGVPAHTISTSKMDIEPNYHKLSDEVKTLDIPNMTEVIKAIAISSASIVSGKDTPSRVDTNSLK
ncbi:M20/M25/M40 family metallo-hydrolase [Filimonas effusa]|uniref:M20/M25/M40 family metallo-hydrolase n=1 Tax=Filimonas effusa TaxID=2508721 RepID=A0A4Q1D483_9BACT|nr:M20/M25/M40 family metallo-hydrolase [Filimonas effusa]RXK83262.1 M20/M25/M40 family metallo-hydrolase [Filimonas effusa]